MYHIYVNFHWVVWMSVTLCSIIFKTQVVSSTNICTTCDAEDCPSYNLNSGSCYCKRHLFHLEDTRWDRYYRSYRTYKGDFLYATAECSEVKELDEHSVLNPSTCPEDPCRYITFIQSNISMLPINFFIGATHLEQIYLNSSGVQSLQVGAFSGLSKLQTLQLEDNELTKIEAGSLNSLIALKTLDLHSNQIITIEDMAFLGLNSLESLDLSRNQLNAISYRMLKFLVNLRELILSYNFLSVVDFNTDNLNKLERLYLNHNNIERIDECFAGTALHSLFLQDNAISYLKGSCFPKELSALNLANNNISTLDPSSFNNLNNLATLNVSKNAISKISIDIFKSCDNLLNLDLSQNDIAQFKTGVFSVAKNIEYLNLSSINLQKIDSHLFIPLTNLKILDVSNNDLKFWDSESFVHFDNLEKIFLGGNNFSCKIVSSIFQQAKTKNFSLVYEADYTLENIKGLTCNYPTVEQDISITTNTSMDNWNELKNAFENISRTVLKNTEAEKALMNNLHSEIPNTIENSIKAEIKSQSDLIKSDFKKTSLDAVYQAIADLLKNTTQNMDTKPTLQMQPSSEKNISSVVQNMGSSVMFLEKKIGSIESNQDSLMNITIFNMEKNLRSSLHQLKILMVICFCICAFILVVLKLLSCCCNSKRKTKSFDLGQELPILS